MSRWSIRFRVVAALVVGVVLALGVVFVFVQRDYQQDSDHAASQALSVSQGSFTELRNRDTIMLMAVLDTLMTRSDLRAALASQNRSELTTLSAPIFAGLKSHYGITHLYFLAPDGTVILRAHKPSEFGDKVARQTFLRSVATGSYGTGLELGKTAFALRVVHPVYASVPTSGTAGSKSHGKLIGYMEVGEEIGHFLDIMHSQTVNDEYALLIPKASLTHAEWTAYRAGNNQRDNWNDQPAYVTDASTSASSTAPISLATPLAALPIQGTRLASRTSAEGTAVSVGAFPVLDASGKASGAVLAVHDLSGAEGTAMQTQVGVVGAVAAATALLALFVLLLLNSLVFDRLKRLAEDTGQGEDVAHLIVSNPKEPAGNADEITRFESRLSDSRRELLVKSELLDGVTDVIYVHDLDGRILYANKAAEMGRGYTHGELLGMNVHDLVEESERAAIAENIARIVDDGQLIFESLDVARDGRTLPVEVHARVIDIEGRQHIVSVVRDISERKKAENTIERLAYFDPLTGAANRRLFQDRLGVAMAQVRRNEGSLAVVFIDVDRLKPINDSLGHPSGDQVLQTVADRLAQLTRLSDTVARLGGDEFVLLLTDTDEAGALHVGERVIEVMAEPVNVGDRELRVSVSAGIVVYRGEDESWERVIQKADLAMYAAKEAGRNRFCLFDESMVADASERFNLQQELATAFDNQQLELHYQPQIRLDDGSVIGAEALCRWFHPTRGEVPPDTFITVAEESGLLLPMGRWVISTACRQVRDWQQSGLPEMCVAVNVSVSQVVNDDLVEAVRIALADNEIDAHCLSLEITESVALGGSPQVRETLRQLAGLGVGLVVDDFGVGYSALDSIAELPMSAIKVDRSFVAKMTESPEREAIVRTVVDLGRHLRLETVAEGVETADQLALLGEMGCAMGQGFYFAPALTAEEFTVFARARLSPCEPDGESP